MRVEDDDSAVDRFGHQVILKRLVDSNTVLVHVSVVDEPDDLVGEQLGVVLAVEVGLCGLRRVQLKILADMLAQDVTCLMILAMACWIRSHAREPVTVCRPQAIS